jgi:hypothetical protein
MLMKRYPQWTLIDWDGNPALHLKCWRKSFGRGHVSVGVGKFQNIVYSHGANSEDSLSSTRWRPDGKHQTEKEAMAMVDRNHGYYNRRDDEYDAYRQASENVSTQIVNWLLE